MTYLFDANAIINLIKKGVTGLFSDGITLDLALYEGLNAIWKEYKLLRRLDEELTYEFINILTKVNRYMKTVSIKTFERNVFELATKEGLTIYDAAYLYIAIMNRLILVTDDDKLREKALKYVGVLTTDKVLELYK